MFETILNHILSVRNLFIFHLYQKELHNSLYMHLFTLHSSLYTISIYQKQIKLGMRDLQAWSWWFRSRHIKERRRQGGGIRQNEVDGWKKYEEMESAEVEIGDDLRRKRMWEAEARGES